MSEEAIRSLVFDTLHDNNWDAELRVRKVSFTADAPSFKIKVPRTSRAGVNETLAAEEVVARLVKVVRSLRTPPLWATLDAVKAAWRKEELAWLLHPQQPQRGDKVLSDITAGMPATRGSWQRCA